MKELTAQQIKDLLSPIPKKEWMINKFSNGKNKCCFLGHLQRLHSNNPKDYSIKNCGEGFFGQKIRTNARELTEKALIEMHGLYIDGAFVNNSPDYNGYTENNPKDRIMHLLDDMIKYGF